ncbi:MAG: hypothetical protein KJ864_02690, partial [Candidatus Omnitrophica bacterium]|nr:hypothetical protein [Candidatus Omnitrophota bacterium]
GEIAIKKGLVSQKDIARALHIQKEYEEIHKIHKELGVILTEKEILTPGDVKIILEEQKNQQSLMAWFTALFGLSR